MKKINFNVIFEDDVLFEKSVKEAVLAQAKQLAREEVAKELQAEIERVVTSRVNDLKQSSYYNTIIHRITDTIVQKMVKDISLDNDQINTMIEEKVAFHLNARLKDRDIDSFIQKYIDKSLSNVLLQRSKQL